ncbi:MAG TPA: hypothetical protein PKW21_07595 [Rhabdaerophilum sp.]|nr:hypothetical protein [Rhabdaerophilum sp.]
MNSITALTRFVMRAALPLLATVLPALVATADARPPGGRYALHREACAANDIFLTLKGDRLDLPVFSCTGLTFTARGAGGGDAAAWNVAAKRCEGEEGKPGPQKFAIEMRGTSMRILWANGDRSAPLQRCGN